MNGIGFDLQISSLYTHTDKIDIKITGKTLDNLLIKALMSVLKSRLPSIIENMVKTTVNPMITEYTCKKIEEEVIVNKQYIAIINTTDVPAFTGDNLYFPVDLTLKNMITNKTNDEVENDNLPSTNPFVDKSNVTAIISSNMVNTILWLIDDSEILKLAVTNDMLGPNPPIALNTLNLSIILPGLQKKWAHRGIFWII